MIHAQPPLWKIYPRQLNWLARSRRVGAIVLLVTAVTLASFAGATERPAYQASLKTAAASLFTVGVGVDYRISERPDDWELLTTQFGIVTPENCMKPAHVQAKEGAFRFAEPA